jgi:hypothetical protein
MIEIRYKDIEPGIGNVTRDELVCTCPTEMLANWVYSALVRDMSLDYDEPNREFYIKQLAI